MSNTPSKDQPNTFRDVFITTIIGSCIVIAAITINNFRPQVEVQQPSKDHVKASGKCASCHDKETPAIVHQFSTSQHAKHNVTCYDCHQQLEGQSSIAHNGFVLAKHVTSANCRTCHNKEYEQFNRSRHAAPSWAAVVGREGFTREQIAHAEKYHPGTVDRAPNALAQLEGQAATKTGCMGCHGIGKPNEDNSIGNCTACHARHSASIELARLPSTCGQCHLGPDHSQVEIYTSSKHGALFAAQRAHMNLSADPKTLSVADMSVPTCTTCHMSGLEGSKVTHDTTERLSWFLYAPVSTQRPHYIAAQTEMQELCANCHAAGQVGRFYEEAEAMLTATNERVEEAKSIITGLRGDGLLTPQPFDEPIEFLYFDYWHYFGRTAKHGAFMGGADYVQWHGNYELLLKLVELKEMAAELRHKNKQKLNEENIDHD